VQSAAGVADAAAAADPGLGTLIDNSRATFHAVAQRAGDLRATLDQMPPTLEAARRSLAAADTTLRTAQQLSGRLEPGITQVRALARPLASLLQTVGRVAPVGTDALRTLGGAAPSLNGLLDRARTPVMPTVEGIGRQAAKQLDCIRPYSPEIGGLFVHWAGFFGIGDGKSKITRAQAGTVPYNNETTANSGQLKQVLGDSFGMAFPRPPGELAGQSWFQPQCGITVVDVKRSGTMAKATLAIDGAKVPLPEDTRAALRLRTLVGESYIELYPGRSRYPLKSGGMLPLSQDVPNVEADEVLSVLRGATRVRAREFIQRLGAGIDGQGPQLNDFLHHATGAIDHASDVAAVLAHDHQDVGDLVQHVGDIMREIGDRSTAIRQLAQDGTTTFQALADRELALRRTLDELPPSLAQVRSTTGTLSAVAGSTAPMLSNLAAAVRELGPAVHALGPAASAGQGLVDELAVAAPRLRGTVGRLTTLAPPTVRALPQVRATLCQLNPMAQFLRPYAADGVAMISNMASATNFYDATGHAARLYAIAGPTSVAGLPPTAKSGIDLLFKSGVLGKGASLGYDPYPAAGTAQQPGAGAGMTGPADHPRFPRVQAEC
jgi:phospholipid/cholesterol/gamma-HCH transport system substrate-binding protein